MLGLLAPSIGNILVGGRDIHTTPGLTCLWQRHVAHVPQDVYLSDGRFAANIAYGIPADQIVYPKLYQAAKKARISQLIETSKEGYDSVVGERGIKLSGGQRQRIGLARALYKNPWLFGTR